MVMSKLLGVVDAVDAGRSVVVMRWADEVVEVESEVAELDKLSMQEETMRERKESEDSKYSSSKNHPNVWTSCIN